VVARRVEAAPRIETPPEAALRFHLSCRDRDAPCLDGVGLLVSLGEEEPNRCTAALVAPDRVLTASHCLSPETRAPGAACDDTWIAFPPIGGREMEWARCARVLDAIALPDESLTMRRDVAMLELARPVSRDVLPIDPRAPEEGSIVTIVSVRPHPIYPTYHELYERLCRVATRESAIETFGPSAGRVGWLMDCPSYRGNSGSPVLDGRGHIRSVLHGGSHPVHGIAITTSLDAR
jgi:hypothetical protein